ncbi:MAG: LegC family aminotransferase [Rhodocyclaceae bacterium]|nr:MAG: LegC family aminotransferase [Rhodocyclaceae bacterium]
MTPPPALDTQLLSALSAVLGRPEGTIGLHEPEFAGNEWAYVKACIDTGWVSSVGKYVDEFECRLAETTGAAYTVAVANGTAALQVALRLAGVEPGDEVLVPTLTFVATANAVCHLGAIPHFVDAEEATLGLDPDALADHLEAIVDVRGGRPVNRLSGRRIAAVVPMHAFGHAMRIERLLEVAGVYAIPVVEDAAESLGTSYRGRHTGTFGLVGTLSFNGNKIITTGGGGAILTNDPELGRRAKHLTTTAKLPHPWRFVHDEVAYNFRLPNLNAALGCAQLESLPRFLAEKRALAARYRTAFADTPGLAFVDAPAGSDSNFWLNAIRIKGGGKEAREQLLAAANGAGYQCRPAWDLMHTLTIFSDMPRAGVAVSEAVAASLINLPSSAKLGVAKV